MTKPLCPYFVRRTLQNKANDEMEKRIDPAVMNSWMFGDASGISPTLFSAFYDEAGHEGVQSLNEAWRERQNPT